MRLTGALLPVATFQLIWLLASVHRRRLGLAGLSLRGTFVVASALFQAVLLAITEVLNVGAHLDAVAVSAAWTIVLVVLAALVIATIGVDGLRTRASSISRSTLRAHVRRWPIELWLALATLVWMVAILIRIGWIYPPNNTDSLVYHLTRVAHWIQESSVGHFATHWTGQIELAPLHEYDMLHLHLLTASDRLDGYVQLGSFVVCVVGASEIARLLGAGVSTQAGAAVIAAVIPSAVLEATSTQNNVFGAAIAVALVVVAFGWVPGEPVLFPAALLGLGMGMWVLAKGTVVPLMLPTMLVVAVRIVISEVKVSSWRTVFRRAALVLIVSGLGLVLAAGPFLQRNRELFGSLTGPVTATTVNAELRWREGAANVVRSAATNFRIGDGDWGIETVVSRSVLGVLRPIYNVFDVPPDDLDFYITPYVDVFGGGDFAMTSRFEEFGANPWHVLLLTGAMIILIVNAARGRVEYRFPAVVGVALALGFVIFSATSRWSVYVARYSLPVMIVWAPLIAIALSSLGRVVRNVTIALLVVAVMPQLLDNWPRSLIEPRNDFASELEAYFVGRALTEPDAAKEFAAVRDAIIASGCDRVGIANWVLLEYPLWAGLEQAGWHGRIEHVFVNNESAVLERTDFDPCILVRQTSGDGLPAGSAWVEETFGSLSLAFPAR